MFLFEGTASADFPVIVADFYQRYPRDPRTDYTVKVDGTGHFSVLVPEATGNQRYQFSSDKILTITKLPDCLSRFSSCYGTFFGCSKLTEICDFPPMPNLTVLDECFSGCKSLVEAPEIDTKKVTTMYAMFNNCSALTTVPDYNTSNVTRISYVFQNCSSLVNTPNWDTAKVTTWNYSFNGCKSLVGAPDWDTSSATSMVAMFMNCSNLTVIPHYNTSKVTTMESMFNGCSSITTIPLFDTSKVTSFKYCFASCSKLTGIPFIDTGTCRNFIGMFEKCVSLTNDGLPALDTHNGTDFSFFLSSCSALTTIPWFDLSNARTLYASFAGMTNIIRFPEGLNTSKVTQWYCTFENCRKLIELPELDTSAGTGFQYTFANTFLVTEIPACYDFSNATATLNIFSGSGITTIHTLDLGNATDLVTDNQSGIKYNSSLNGMNPLTTIESFVGPSVNFRIFNTNVNLTHDSLLVILNGLPEVSDGQILYIGSVPYAKLSASDIAIATDKGWTVTVF